jgi:hypothetical protein
MMAEGLVPHTCYLSHHILSPGEKKDPTEPTDPFGFPLALSQETILTKMEEFSIDPGELVLGSLWIQFLHKHLWQAVIHNKLPGITMYQVNKPNGSKEEMAVGQRYVFPNKGSYACGIAVDGGNKETSFYIVGPAVDFDKIEFNKSYKIDILATGLPSSESPDIFREGRAEHPLYYHWSRLYETPQVSLPSPALALRSSHSLFRRPSPTAPPSRCPFLSSRRPFLSHRSWGGVPLPAPNLFVLCLTNTTHTGITDAHEQHQR